MPGADRIVVKQKRGRDTLTAPSFVEKDERIRPARKPMFGRPVPSKLGQVFFSFSIEKSAANHSAIWIPAAVPRKGFFRLFSELGYSSCPSG